MTQSKPQISRTSPSDKVADSRADFPALNQQVNAFGGRADNRYIPVRVLASESAELTKAAIEKNRQETISAFQRNDQERLAEFDRQNAEIKRRHEEFLKNVDKNQPQKGEHKDYSTYNKNFKQIIRKCFTFNQSRKKI